MIIAVPFGIAAAIVGGALLAKHDKGGWREVQEAILINNRNHRKRRELDG